MLWAGRYFVLRALRYAVRPATVFTTAAIVLSTAAVVEAPNTARHVRAARAAPSNSHGLPSSIANRAISVRVTSELLEDISSTDSRDVAFATVMSAARLPLPLARSFNQPAASLPATKAKPGPAIRGLYTGAAKSRIVWMEVTGYCPCTLCCGPSAQGVTASGKGVDYAEGFFIAADAAVFPFGSMLRVPGYHDGKKSEVVDRGSDIKGPRLDVFFPTHEQAAAWGRQWLPVTVE